ncbi:uncharacterized protein LOC143615450 [Bidens hawaiensis]|uniref:uncharacterized protein LOC143615450 n=1 Tax=Bidens hawaiensis TaxID=980011 RepID=UPI00404B93FB
MDEDDKANVLHRFYRYKLFRHVSNLFHLIELLIAVALISRSSSRVVSVIKSFGDNLLTFSSSLLNHRVVFLVGNVIIVVCYVLSRCTDDGNTYSYRKTTGDASIGESVTVTPVTEEEEKPNGELYYDNDVIKTEETYGEEEPNENDGVTETEIEVAIKQAVRQLERFRRTQSEKLKREISIKAQQRELRRSVTAERSGLLVTSGEDKSSETVEELSNEEFQIAIENFILKQQSFLKQEGMAENGNQF